MDATPILDTLSRFARAEPHAAFYTPGHRRGWELSPRIRDAFAGGAAAGGVFRFDLPELEDLDNLFAPEGVIAEAQELAARAFGAERTFFLVNGTTCGIVAAILATCREGDELVLPRNAHQSAVFGLVQSGARPVFVQPACDDELGIAHVPSASEVARALEEHPRARAVLIVSPTYFGVCADVAGIAAACRARGVPLIVDEAHGAHFGGHEALPPSAVSQGADIAVQSTHKVLTAMTQASMLHLGSSSRVDPGLLAKALQLVQSSSPSYLLLASLDAARHHFASPAGRASLARAVALARRMREGASAVPGASVLGREHLPPSAAGLDVTRVTVALPPDAALSGFEAEAELNGAWGVFPELATFRTLTFIVSPGSSGPDIELALSALPAVCRRGPSPRRRFPALPRSPPRPVLTPREAFFSDWEAVPWSEAAGRVSVEAVCPYPPGVPLLLPGEEVTAEAAEAARAVAALGGRIAGCADASLATLRVARR
eukprot:tig00000459_g1080.t1